MAKFRLTKQVKSSLKLFCRYDDDSTCSNTGRRSGSRCLFQRLHETESTESWFERNREKSSKWNCRDKSSGTRTGNRFTSPLVLGGIPFIKSWRCQGWGITKRWFDLIFFDHLLIDTIQWSNCYTPHLLLLFWMIRGFQVVFFLFKNILELNGSPII